MTIHKFELFHAIVLTKIVRSDRPLTLRMIETRPNEAWSAYTLNDEVDLFIKHCSNWRAVSRGGDGKSWSFVFSVGQIKQMAFSKTRKLVFVALVGGGRNINDDMQVCLLEPDELDDLIDLNSDTSQALTVKYIPRKKLMVIKDRKERLKVSQNRLDQWDIPGS